MLPKASYRLVGYKLQVINLDFRLKNWYTRPLFIQKSFNLKFKINYSLFIVIVFPGRVAVIELSYIAEQVMAGSR